MIEEADLRAHLLAIRRSGHWDALLELIYDHAGRATKEINRRLRRGKPLVPEDYPVIQLEQGKIQGLQELADDLDRYAKEEKEEPTPQTRQMDV